MRDELRPLLDKFRRVLGVSQLNQSYAALAGQIATLSQTIHSMDQKLDRQAPPAPPAKAPLSDFVTINLPNGKTYELSVGDTTGDDFLQAVAAGGANDLNWHFMNDWVRPGDVLFDLGANIGTISIPAAVNGATVHAFELLDVNAQTIARSALANKLEQISIIIGAVADKPGFAGIGGFSAWGQVVAEAMISLPHIVIDDYVEQRAIGPVDFIKLDVEGSERRALSGAARLIARDHPDIMIECNAASCGGNGYSYRELLRHLAGHGYDLYRLHERTLCPWDADRVQEVIYTDYFATTKPPSDLTARSGWPVAPLQDEAIIQSILNQDRFGDLHKQFLRATHLSLPAAIQADPRVQAMLQKWAALDDPRVLSILQTGAA
jgi:FkbM family methyltransferase